MAGRKSSASVQLKVRLKEPTRADVERAAKRRGISLNAEMVDRIESGTMMTTLAEGKFGISDLARFRDYVDAIRRGLQLAGEDEEQWLGYARYVHFPVLPSDTQEVFAAVAQAVDADHAADAAFIREYLKTHDKAPEKRRGPPMGPDHISPEADYRWRAERYARVEANRRRARGKVDGRPSLETLDDNTGHGHDHEPSV